MNLDEAYKHYPILTPNVQDNEVFKGLKATTAYEMTMDKNERALHFIERRAYMYKQFMQSERDTMLSMDKTIAYCVDLSKRTDYTKENSLEILEQAAEMVTLCITTKRDCMKNIKEYGEIIRWLRKLYQTKLRS